MTDYAAQRRARQNAIDADRNSAAIRESVIACVPHAAAQFAARVAEAERDGSAS